MERGCIYKLSIFLEVPELSIQTVEGVKREANLVNRVDRICICHVLGRTIVELNPLDVVLQFCLLKHHRINLQFALLDAVLEFFNSSLAGLVFTFHSDDDPVVHFVKDLQGLAVNLIEY